MEEAKRTIAYICPSCRQAVIVEKTAFALAAGPASIPCPCGRSELKTEMLGDRIKITVPCQFCGGEHTVVCPTHAFLHQRALAFTCAASGLDCCYVGEEDAVFAAMERLEGAADKLAAEKEQRGAFLDEVIMHEVLSELKDIAARGGISCTCGSKAWKLQVNYSSVDLFCADCGAALRIPAATEEDLTDLCCKTALLIHGKKA